jgi:competence protein ComEC
VPPALFPALALLAGAVAGGSIDLSLRVAWPLLPMLLASAAVARWRAAGRTAWVLTVAGFGLGSALLASDARNAALHPLLRTVLEQRVGGFAIESLGPENDHDPIRIRAELAEDAAVREDYVSLRARVLALEYDGRWEPVEGGVTLTVGGDAGPARAGEWRAGRVIETRATVRRPARYLNDGVPDAEWQLALDGTTLFGSVKSGLLIDVVARGSAFREWAAGVRARVRSAVARWVSPHDMTAAAIVTAVLIGDRTGLPDDITDRLQRAGTYHVIAISGGNIAVLAGLVLGLLALSGLPGRVRASVAIGLLIAYAGIATAGPSVWRATMMAVVYLTARLLDHRTPPWQATTLAAGVMAVVAPLDVTTAGFVLTFGATGALLESARMIQMKAFTLARRDPAKPRHAGPWSGPTTQHCVSGRFATRLGEGGRRVAIWLLASVAASIAVELTLLPVAAASFSRVTIAGPLLNLVAVPLMAVAQIGGLAVAAFDRWPAVAQAAGWVASASASGIVESARLVDAAPAFSWRVPPPGIALLAVYYGSLLVVVFSTSTWRRVALALVQLFALAVIVTATGEGKSSTHGGFRLTVFDVGQGEAMLLESGGSRLQIDTGGVPFGAGRFDIGARVLAPALWARGIGRLDAMLLTHGDPDHIGGASVLIDVFRPRALWEGIVVPRHEPSRRLRDQAASSRIAVIVRRTGEAFEFGNTRIRVLHPAEPDWERPRVRNDDSVVLEVTCGDVALLLTGDASADVERAFAPQLTPARTRILKVAHHGSRTSTSNALLEAWRPQIALISAGRGNTFGHPTPEVIQRLESIGAQIYRTDRQGQITLESDCQSVFVRTFTNEKR